MFSIENIVTAENVNDILLTDVTPINLKGEISKKLKRQYLADNSSTSGDDNDFSSIIIWGSTTKNFGFYDCVENEK